MQHKQLPNVVMLLSASVVAILVLIYAGDPFRWEWDYLFASAYMFGWTAAPYGALLALFWLTRFLSHASLIASRIASALVLAITCLIYFAVVLSLPFKDTGEVLVLAVAPPLVFAVGMTVWGLAWPSASLLLAWRERRRQV